MGTYYINKLQIEGAAHEVELAKGSLRGQGEDGEDCDIDFKKIVPEPMFEPIELDRDIRDCLKSLADPQIQSKLPSLNDMQFDTLVAGLRNYRKTGFFASPFWRIANWGTPWNARSYREKGKDVDAVYFITKMFPPENAIEQLSRRLGNLAFIHTFYPESMDEIYQMRIVNGSRVLTIVKENLENSSLFQEF